MLLYYVILFIISHSFTFNRNTEKLLSNLDRDYNLKFGGTQ